MWKRTLLVDSCLYTLTFHNFKYIMPLPKSFGWKISFITLWEFFCILLLIFPCCCKIFFVFNFCQLDYCESWVFLLVFILPGTLWAFWTWLTVYFPMSGNFSADISSNIFSGPFSLFLWEPMMKTWVRSMLLLRCLRLFISFHSLLFIFCPIVAISTILHSNSLIHSSASSVLLMWVHFSFQHPIAHLCLLVP